MNARDRAALTEWERKTLALIAEAARTGRRAPTADDIQEHTGCNSISTTVNIVQSLEKRGLISVERFQRSRRITILETGMRTAAVINETPHWRSGARPRSTPSVPISWVQARKPDLARQLIVAARHEGMSVQDFLGALVWAGWKVRAKGEDGESKFPSHLWEGLGEGVSGSGAPSVFTGPPPAPPASGRGEEEESGRGEE